MDLRLQLNTGDLISVEMQSFSHKGFGERVFFTGIKTIYPS